MSVFRQWFFICSVRQGWLALFFCDISTLDIVDLIQKCFTISFYVVTVQKCPIRLSQLSIQFMQLLIQYFRKLSLLSCFKRNLYFIQITGNECYVVIRNPCDKMKRFELFLSCCKTPHQFVFRAVNSHKSVNHV